MNIMIKGGAVPDKIYELHAEMCKIFTSPKRLEILNLLKGTELSVGDLMRLSKSNQANLSQHLSVLRQKGIVKTRREGVRIYYSLEDGRIIQAFDIIRDMLLERMTRIGKFSKYVRNKMSPK
jgi:ArsR family transcriptional regulator